MTEADAKHAIELYTAIRSIDRKLEQVASHHRIVASVWAWSATGNYGLDVEMQKDSQFTIAAAVAIRGQLLHERELRAGGLARLGFEPPALKTAERE
jgi:hypothetical protein